MKTGIPVIVLDYGNLTYGRKRLQQSLQLMAEVLGKTERAKAVMDYFQSMEDERINLPVTLVASG